MVSVAQGPAHQSGYRYQVTLTNVGADRDVSITCFDTVSSSGFYTFTMHTDAAGNASVQDECWSGDPGFHWVTADDGMLTSNAVTW